MERVDLVIKSGKIARSDGVFEAGIAVKDGKIIGILEDHLLPDAKEVVYAKGKVVMAGVIDPHVHVRDLGEAEKEDWTTATMAAAAGGVTTLLDHPNNIPPTNSAAALTRKRDIASGKALVDFALYGGNGEASIERIMEQAEAGAVAFKTFLFDLPGRAAEFNGLTCTQDDALLDIFEAVAKTGLVQALHGECQSIVDHYTKKLLGASRKEPVVWEESRPVLAEVEAVSRAILFAMETGVRLNIPHLSSGSAASLVREAKRKGYHNITGETSPHHLFLTNERMAEIGPYAKMTPPLRSRQEQEKLWECLVDGTIDTIGSDHSPHLPERKEKGWDDIFVAPGGSPGLETSLPVMLTSVHQGRISLQALTRLMSENAARIYGLYPRKGVIQVGSDADLVIVDMDKETTVDRRKMHTKQKALVPLFEGWHVVGVPVMTIVRGTVVMRDGEIIGEPGYGQFVAPLKKGS